MPSFDELFKSSVRYRHVSRELESLLRDLHASFSDPGATREALERLLHFLAGAGRTDANCTATYFFTTATEPLWQGTTPELRAILDDMSGTLQDSIHAATIARTFEATPEQLLERVKKLM